ncbi:hypothetical protein CTAYLR_002525 [Chrysophaeum taylorii]|uniref:Uncharacterized protein n=1 Tax=Chrysophaeum taylorii TaxID=2483200 RepID=A0AAD7XMH9_9STRA|nr:hypothetical protein CTAYLR_002525 [Chrysophaeum taylorii]
MGRRVLFCCKTELRYNALGDPECGRHDLVFVGSRGEPVVWDLDTVVELVAVVGSNLLFAAPVWELARRGRACEVLTGLALAVTSTLYHVCDTARVEILSMNAGNWHRLDNVFTILSFGSLGPLLMGRAATQAQVDGFRAAVLVFGLFFQELNPWSLPCMLAPVCAASVLYAAWAATYAARGHHRRRLATREFWWACGVQVVSLACFARGLDHQNGRDPRRLFHGAWHALNALAATLFVRALDQSAAAAKQS